jgi:hypothetical protein
MFKEQMSAGKVVWTKVTTPLVGINIFVPSKTYSLSKTFCLNVKLKWAHTFFSKSDLSTKFKEQISVVGVWA